MLLDSTVLSEARYGRIVQVATLVRFLSSVPTPKFAQWAMGGSSNRYPCPRPIPEALATLWKFSRPE